MHDPGNIIVCCCGWHAERTAAGFDRLRSEAWWTNLKPVQSSKVHIVNAEAAFTQPGPSLLYACRLLTVIFNRSVTTTHFANVA